MVGSWEYESVLIGVPQDTKPPEQIWFDSLQGMRFENPFSPRVQFPHWVSVVKRAPLDQARNMIANQAIENDVSLVFWVDSDVIIRDPFAFQKLYLDMKKTGYKIVSGIYWSKKGQTGIWNIDKDKEGHTILKPYDMSKVDTNGDGLIYDAELVGSGLMLVDVSVYKDLEYPWYDYQTDFVRDPYKFGEDFYFLNKARDKGYKLLVDTKVMGNHTFIASFDPYGKVAEIP